MRIALLIDRQTYLNIQQSMVMEILQRRVSRRGRRTEVPSISIDQMFGNHHESPIEEVPNKLGYNFYHLEDKLDCSFYTASRDTSYGVIRIAENHYAYFKGQAHYLTSITEPREFERTLLTLLGDILRESKLTQLRTVN